MRNLMRTALPALALGLLLSACNSATGPKLPDPTEPGEPRDSLPTTAALSLPAAVIV